MPRLDIIRLMSGYLNVFALTAAGESSKVVCLLPVVHICNIVEAKYTINDHPSGKSQGKYDASTNTVDKTEYGGIRVSIIALPACMCMGYDARSLVLRIRTNER